MKFGSEHALVKQYFSIVDERMLKVGKKKEWLRSFGEAKTDFERVCFLLKSLESSSSAGASFLEMKMLPR